MTPLEQSLAVGRAIKLLLRTRHTPAKRVSSQLGFHPTTLSRMFSSTSPLRLRLVLDVLALLKERADFFFAAVFPLGGSAAIALDALPKTNEAAGRMATFVAVMAEKAPPLAPPAELVAYAGDWLREALAAAGLKQRDVSRSLGLGDDTLGQALRGNAELTLVQVFAALQALGVDPGRFFFELFLPRPQTPMEALARAQVAGLFERGVKGTAAAMLKRRETEAAKARAAEESPQSAGEEAGEGEPPRS